MAWYDFDWVGDAWDWTKEEIIDPFIDFNVDAAKEMWDTYEGIIDAFDIEMPSYDSPTYNSGDTVGNTTKEGQFVARCYGNCKIGCNKLRFNDGDDSDLRIIVGHCMGEIDSVSTYYINDVEWSELTGSHTKTLYTGTRTQTADARFSTNASAYRDIAYTAFTFEKNDKQIGYDPNIVIDVIGKKCAPLAGGAIVATRNPAVILYDWYLNVEGYSAGDLDLNAFLSLEELCDEEPAGGTLPRYRFDFNFDSNMTINDAKKIIWASFNGRVIMSQGKLKPVWDSSQQADGAGSLEAKTVSHAFTLDNIVQGSLTWHHLERPNTIRVYYKDSDKSSKTSSVEIKDEIDINTNGEILSEESVWFITDAELARRRAKFKYSKKRYPDYAASFTALSGASDLEVLDLVTITHILPGWITKQFLITSKSEDSLGRMTFTAEAYFSGIYDDSQVATQANFESTLPNPYVPEPVTSVALAEGGFIAGDGSYVPYITLTFTTPNNAFWFRGQVYVSTDAGVTYTFYGNATTGDGYRIEAGAANYEEGDTVYVKVLSENTNGSIQVIGDVSAVSEYIDGKTALPSDVTNFTATQIGSLVLFTADRPSHALDADFDHFELREGSSWASSAFISTYTQTSYPLSSFTTGVKTYRIKAVDSSGNKSETEAIKVLTLTSSSVENDYYSSQLLKRVAEGTLTQVVEHHVSDYADGFFIAGTETMDDAPTETMDDSATDRMWTAAYTTGSFLTEAIDVGAIVQGSILLTIESTAYTGGGYTVQYQYSEDGITYSALASFSDGVIEKFRYLKFKFNLTADTSGYPEDNIKVTSVVLTVDLPTVTNTGGADVTIAASGTTITFDNAYTTLNSIKITLTPVSATALIPTVTDKTLTNFKAHLFNTSGSDVSGVADWSSEGY